ncbi:acyltransferase family protein [Deinococcus marmoris]|uniref:acyltransferase family protein n=1 Tax=Deinococcus marmoris TaxID=249408 RepID=UPI000B1E64A1|nr:acyltransferase [Deinococcus marmoris]
MTEPVSVPLLRALTGLRAIAALWVVFHHYFDKFVLLFPVLEPLRAFAQAGNMGVELFLVLSGFVITLNYVDHFRVDQFRQWNGPTYIHFLRARIARIYPVVVACLLGALGIVTVANRLNMDLATEGLYTPGGFVASLLMVQAWGNSADATWNFVAWSVSAEWFAYLCFPLVALLYHRVRTSSTAVGIAGAAIVVSISLILTSGLSVVSPFDHNSLLRVTGSFVAGAMMCWLWRNRFGASWNWGLLTPVLGLLAVASATALTAMGTGAYWTLLFMTPFILGLAYSRGWLARALSTSLADFGGRISYSMYMSHLLLKMVLVKLLPAERFAESGLLLRLGIVAVYIALILAVATALYLLIEEPFRKLLRPSPRRKPAPDQSESKLA